MARPTAGDRPPTGPLSPYQAPPAGLVPPVVATASGPFVVPGPPVAPAPATGSTPTLWGLLHALRRRWPWAVGAGLAAAAVFALAVWLILPAGKHEVRALVNLRDKSSDLTARTAEDYDAYRREQIFILKTRDLAARTVNDPAVAALPMIRDAEDKERVIEDNLSVTAVAPTILAVTLRGNSIEEMKVIVDTLVKKYVEDATALDRRRRDDEIKKLERLESSLREEIEALERQLRVMVRGTGATGGESNEQRLALMNTRLSQLDAELHQLGREIARAEAERAYIQKQLAGEQPLLDPALIAAAVRNDKRVVELTELRDKARIQYEKDAKIAADPANDPTVRESKDRWDKAEAALAAVTKSVTAEVEAVERSKAVASLKAKLAELEAKIATSVDLRDRTRLDRDALAKAITATAEGNFDVAAIMGGLAPQREALARIRTQLVNLRLSKELDNRPYVREFAQALPNNNLTKKLLAAGAAGSGAFGLVVFLVAYFEWRTRRVDGVHQVVAELGLRVIGTIPVLPGRSGSGAADAATDLNRRFVFTESVNSARTMLLHAARDRSMQVVMVTSALQGEGKTTLASHLASSMAAAGLRCLLIDCDLRNPSVHTLFDLPLAPGVSEVLTQQADAADAVQPTAQPNLWVMTAGGCSEPVLAALAQGHPLETLFNRLRGQFDFVIVDSCPVLPVADALLVAQHVDGVVFSILLDVSQLPQVLSASEKLSQLNIPLLGAIVNGTRQDVFSYGYNYVKQLPA